MKMVLALEKYTIPPHMLFITPNPKIPWETAKLSVAMAASPWPASARERVRVNSFSISGANAHLIMDSAASFNVGGSTTPRATASCPELLVFFSPSPESLRRTTKNYKMYIDTTHLPYRSFAVIDGTDSMEFPSPTKSGASPLLIWVFTGQGAQWAGTGQELFGNYSSYCDDIRAMDAVLANCPHPPAWNIEGRRIA
ncbi:uncharacterized protein BP5553_01446 [Venustampulla echinocandica]|uniref:Polyketide synthase C-terminal extension domain-containing protein n=1 Tax=Venustampulla echinocandica TaxID=2656787 RepID=A0A370U121_9HELO|nr:uncharacterized protein BP5553_01446 [Venustampulla echinocandica]RDL41467.1 hypothetical protein BP5553_01446 [Venustampulla echinocandica]